MPAPARKVFVSHSSPDDASKARLKAFCKALSDKGYAILVDYEQIASADDWRKNIHEMLAECHAAVILFSRAAVESQWVIKEATVLEWRQSLDDDFRLF